MSGEDCLTHSPNDSLSLHDVSISNCKMEPPKLAKRLIPSVKFKDKLGNTPLHRAANNPNCTVESIKMYLHTSFLNDKNLLWHTPLHCIIMGNCQKLDVIALLLNKGADVNAVDRNGSTALHKALQNPLCTPELIDLLLNEGAHLNVKQYVFETPLMYAVRSLNPNLEIIDKLLYRGCIDICMKHFENHRTLLILCSNLLLVKMFLQYSTYKKTDDIEDDDDYSEDEIIINLSCPDSICGFKSLEGSGSKYTDLATGLLMYAVKNPMFNMDVVKELLQYGACIYSENCKNRCVLEYALRNPKCSLKLIQELLKYDSPDTKWVAVDHKCSSFLHVAASNRNCPAEVMNLLLKRDRCRNLNQENHYHLTPLDCAADCTRNTHCNLEMVETLLMKGATTCTSSTIDMSVLWKNIQVLGSTDANRDVLDCTKLLVKYALVEKMREVEHAFTCITKMCARFLRRDKCGYFAELTTYLRECFAEVMVMCETKFPHLTFFEFTIRFGCSLGGIDVTEMNQTVFRLLASNKFPLYCKLIVSLLKKEVLVNNIVDVLLYTTNEDGSTVYLNAYCNKQLACHMGNEDLFNLYLSFMDQEYTMSFEHVQEKWPEDDSDIEYEEEEITCCCIIPPKKRCRLH